ncbi:N-lysine methyltransferase SETD6 [Bufo bufo]|uniref:N-lysine methyltransferase SETD6 n=1 Tax=Bufo bufo TaxID=8384 RepID=UPI001ABE3570|nr:N-lysine methyltransferase SETD6 [Bufo bufo]XP_040265922.1 N-lysine methyltransferase SETD6 [Bufo bufo]
MSQSLEPKRLKVEEEDDALLPHFLQWCQKVVIQLNPKVYMSRQDAVSQYGMLTREDLPAGEVIFSIPRSALLSQHTTRIRALLEEEHERLDSRSGWVSLLISLMYEATDESSPWAPYFGLWPQLNPPDLPMFWSEEERLRLLKGTGVNEAVQKDLKDMEEEYRTIVLPFIRRHPTMFCPHRHSLDLYKRLVAFVMAYSFQEPLSDEDDDCGKDVNPPVMVPVADLLNHVAQHNAHLEFTPECLRMVTTRPVAAGHELFNTYGEMGNWQLLHMYGFSEPHPNNSNEAADIYMLTLQQAALLGAESEEEKARVQERWAVLCQMDMVGEEGAFVFGCDGALTEEELRTSLKVLCMSPEEFDEYKENEGWEEDDGEEETLSNQEISQLPPSWRRLLYLSAELALKGYASDLGSDQALLENEAVYTKLSHREQYSLHVRYGQKRILHQLLELTASTL